MLLSHTSRVLSRVAPFSRALLTRSRYATEAEAPAAGNLLNVSFYLPHAPLFTNKQVNLLTVPGAGGYMGIAKNHMPIIAELKPGVITVDEGAGKSVEKYFVSGGFAYVQADKTCEITAVEAFPLDQLDADAVKKGLTQYNQEYSSATDPESKAKAQVCILSHIKYY
jgi:F-type H+-transporting ATPase subunit delta